MTDGGSRASHLRSFRQTAARMVGGYWWHARRMDRDLRDCRQYVHGSLLDLGCGAMPYKPILEPPAQLYVGMDLPLTWRDGTVAHVVGDALGLPFGSGSFDTVLCTQVLEHLSSPSLAFGEMARVLRPGGHLLLTSPLMQAVHEAPRDYYRITEYGLRELAASVGLRVVKVLAQGGFWCMAGQTLNFWLWDRVEKAPYLVRNGTQLVGGVAMLLFAGLDRLMPEPRYTINYLSVYEKPNG